MQENMAYAEGEKKDKNTESDLNSAHKVQNMQSMLSEDQTPTSN